MPPEEPEAPPPLARPPALQKGDTIGVVAPSYAPREGWLMRRFQRVEDERRANNFMEIWLDPEVKAVIGGTGGYGAVRMIPYLDPEIFRRNPKAFVGYSDITALHIWLM